MIHHLGIILVLFGSSESTDDDPSQPLIYSINEDKWLTQRYRVQWPTTTESRSRPPRGIKQLYDGSLLIILFCGDVYLLPYHSITMAGVNRDQWIALPVTAEYNITG
jgi:hypothetical protein